MSDRSDVKHSRILNHVLAVQGSLTVADELVASSVEVDAVVIFSGRRPAQNGSYSQEEETHGRGPGHSQPQGHGRP
jgi:hypothetical protein